MIVRRSPARDVDAGGVAGVRAVVEDQRVVVAHQLLAVVHAVLGDVEARAMERGGGVVDANARDAASAQGDGGIAQAVGVGRAERRGVRVFDGRGVDLGG